MRKINILSLVAILSTMVTSEILVRIQFSLARLQNPR